MGSGHDKALTDLSVLPNATQWIHNSRVLCIQTITNIFAGFWIHACTVKSAKINVPRIFVYIRRMDLRHTCMDQKKAGNFFSYFGGGGGGGLGPGASTSMPMGALSKHSLTT